MVLPRLSDARPRVAVWPGLLLLLAGCGDPQTPLRFANAPAHRDELRPTDTSSSEMWRYLAADTVEHFDAPDSGFRVHFTRAGPNAVPAADADDSGVPDMAEAVAGVYALVASKYHLTMGYRRPLNDLALGSNGGSDRFDVYLLDFALSADGSFRTDQCSNDRCIGYVVQENDFVGYGYPNATIATRILGSHEYFHAVQAAYDNNQGNVIAEGTAVWATEQFDPSTNDFEGFLPGFMSRPDRSLDQPPPGPVPAFAYGSAIFFEFLSEKFGQPIVRKLWERCENGNGDPSEPANVANPYWIVQLDALLKTQYQSSFAEVYRTFVLWNLYTGAFADPSKAYANGANYATPAMSAVTAPQQLQALRVFYASAQYFRMPADARTTMGAVLIDDPATPDDETDGTALVIAVRRGNINSSVLILTAVKDGTPTVDTSGGAQLVVAVVNTVREGINGVLSRKPSVCIGSPLELIACRTALDPAFDAGAPDAGPPDAGLPDAGPPDAGLPDAGPRDAGPPDAGPGVDAGVPEDRGSMPDAGEMPSNLPRGCGCSSGGASPLGVLALWVLAWTRRRPPPRRNER